LFRFDHLFGCRGSYKTGRWRFLAVSDGL